MLQLFDLAGIYYRAFYALPSSIVGPDGRPINAVRGTLDMLARVIDEARPDRIVACLDEDWRPAWRVALVPSYKAHRVAVTEPRADASFGSIEDVPDDLARQVPVILDLLRALDVPLAGAAECEADDVIATLSHRERASAVEVVTGDRDLFQVVRDEPTPVRVRYIGAGMNKMRVIGVTELRDEFGVDGPGYAAMATLRGDPSDGLPGVAGIGAKTAARLVEQFGSVDGIVAAAADPASHMAAGVRSKITAHQDYLARATGVVGTRTDATVVWDPPDATDGAIRPSAASPPDPGELAATHGVGRSVGRLRAAIERCCPPPARR